MQIGGKYSFVSQENFDEYLKAADIGMLKRKLIAASKPDMIVEVDGNRYTVTTILKLKTLKIAFTLGQVYEADPGTDRITKYITVKDGNALVTREVEDPESVVIMNITDDGFIMTMATRGVIAVRVFGRA